MKTVIHIHTQDGKTIYRGKMIHLPFKPEAIQAKCIDLFNDSDPCIIHQSYAVSHFVEIMEKHYLGKTVVNHALATDAMMLDFLNIPDLETLYLTMEVTP